MQTRIGIVDDHQLFLKSLTLLLETFGEYLVVVEALNGMDLQEKMKSLDELPELMLIDVEMPKMDGVETATWLNETYPAIRLIALSMNDTEGLVIEMLKAGCCAYLLKDTHPTEFERALIEVRKNGYYNADARNILFRRMLKHADDSPSLHVNSKERTFLKLACSDLTYKQIAEEMQVSQRTVDGYRESLFHKFNVQSRVGLCMEALKKGIVKL